MLCLLLAASSIFARSSTIVVASGETHAMLYPCDCTVAPGGGLAQRATVLDSLRKLSPLLLLDAGGFCGGGIYDSYTEGRARDSIRSQKTIAAMGLMRYDAVALGDDDLIFGATWLCAHASKDSLPLVCANIFTKDNKPLLPAFRIVTRNGIRFGITAVITQENIVQNDTSIRITNPIEALKIAFDAMGTSYDVPIILAHTGEEATKAIADAFPACKILINGHRKTSATATVSYKNATILQFGFQGKALSALSIADPKSPFVAYNDFIDISASSKADPRFDALLAEKGTVDPPKHNRYDLYIMSQCPYGLPALGAVRALIRKTPTADLYIYFIGTVNPDSTVTSLHGDAEITDEKLWLAVEALYPNRYGAFCDRRTSETSTTRSIIIALGLDTTAIDRWIKHHAAQTLATHYARSQRIGISASPTLLINTAPTTFDIIDKRLLSNECASTLHKEPYCDSLPACIDNADCRKKGFLGTCDTTHAKASCTFKPDTAFHAIILYSRLARDPSFRPFVQTTLDLFPAASIDSIPLETPLGDSLQKRFNPQALPFYLFDSKVYKTFNFPIIADGLTDTLDMLTFKEGVYPANYFYKRQLQKKAITLFIDPFFPDAKAVLRTALDAAKTKRYIYIKPFIAEDPTHEASSPISALQREEALRWLVFLEDYPNLYFKYLQGFALKTGSEYGYKGLKSVGISIDKFIGEMSKKEYLLRHNFMQYSELGIFNPVTALIDNREIVTLRNLRDLETLFAF